MTVRSLFSAEGRFADQIAPLELSGRKGPVSFAVDEHPKATTAEALAAPITNRLRPAGWPRSVRALPRDSSVRRAEGLGACGVSGAFDVVWSVIVVTTRVVIGDDEGSGAHRGGRR